MRIREKEDLYDVVALVLYGSGILAALILGVTPVIRIEGPVYEGVIRLWNGHLNIMGSESTPRALELSGEVYTRSMLLAALNMAALLIILSARKNSDAVLVLSYSLATILLSYSLITYRFWATAVRVYSNPPSIYSVDGGTLIFPPHSVSVFGYRLLYLVPGLLGIAGAVVMAIPRFRPSPPKLDSLDYAGIAAGLVFFLSFIVLVALMRISVVMPTWSPGSVSIEISKGYVSMDERVAGGRVTNAYMNITSPRTLLVEGRGSGTHIRFELPVSLVSERTIYGRPTIVKAYINAVVEYPTCNASFKSRPLILTVPHIPPRFTATISNGTLWFHANGYPPEGIINVTIQWYEARVGLPDRYVGGETLKGPLSDFETPVLGDYARIYVWYRYLGVVRVYGFKVYP